MIRESPALRRSHRMFLPLAALALAALIALPGSARAESVNFCFNVWAPYMYLDDGVVDGLSKRVLEEASRRAGLTALFHELPWKRCLHLVETGEMDAVVDAAARDEFSHGKASYNVYSNTFWVAEDSPIEVFSMEALRGKTVGLVTGYNYPGELVNEPPYAVDWSVDDETLLRKLAAGRVDAVVADLVGTRWFATREGLAIRALLPSHSFDRLYPSFNRQRGALQARIDAALAAMIVDGFVHRQYREILGLDFEQVVEPGR